MLEKTYESSPLYESHPIASWICIISIFLFILNFIILFFSKKGMTFNVLITIELIIGLIMMGFSIFLLTMHTEKYQIYSGTAHVDELKIDQKHLNQKIITLSKKDEKNTFIVDSNNIQNIQKNDDVHLRIKVNKTLSNKGSNKENLSNFAYEPAKEVQTIDKIEYDKIEISKK